MIVAVSTVVAEGQRVDVLIVAAILLEYEAVLAVGTGAAPGSAWRVERGPAGLDVSFRTFLTAEGGSLRVAATRALEMGGVATAASAAPLVTAYRPRCLAMCGVCAGRRGEVALGDVIIADRLWTYDTGAVLVERDAEGREVGRFKADPFTYNLDPEWRQAAETFRPEGAGEWRKDRPRSYEDQGDWLLARLLVGEDPARHADRRRRCADYDKVLAGLWKRGLVEDARMELTGAGRARIERNVLQFPDGMPEPPPHAVRMGPIGTGTQVVRDPEIFDKLSEPMRKVLGLEMEAAAIGAVAHQHDVPRILVMKGVMDHADPDKSDNFRAFAARASAECLIAFLRAHPPPAAKEASRPGDVGTGGGPPAPSDVERRLGDAAERRRNLRAVGEPVEGVTREILHLKRLSRDGLPHLEGARFGGGRYVLVRPIGQGGFATVWLAIDQQGGTRVALKILHGLLVGDAVRRERFLRGAQKMSEIDHPAVARVIDLGADDDRPYFTMEFFEGGDLRQAILENRTPRAAAIPLVLRIGEALSCAHGAGLVHRDVKPANVLLRSTGEAVLSDFDLVAYKDTTGGTRTGALGTFIYAAPELLDQPQAASAAADVYGLAMTAVFVLYGKDLPADTVRNSAGFIDRLDAEPRVKSVLKRGVIWDLERRYPTAREFCEDLAYAAGGGRPRPPAAPRDGRNILAWSSGGGLALETRWLRLSSPGDEVELVGKRRGLWFAYGDRLYEWQVSRRPVRLLDPADLEAMREKSLDYDELRRVDTSITDTDLVDVLSGTRVPTSLPEPTALADVTLFELYRSTVVLGSLPRYLFMWDYDHIYGGGAHFEVHCGFRVFDFEALAFVDPLLDDERRRACARERPAAAARLQEEHGEALAYSYTDPESPDPELTLLYPTYDAEGRLVFRYQFTGSASFAASDHHWHSYTVSSEISSGEIPCLFRPYAQVPAVVARAWPAIGAARARVGWSEVTSPPVLAWLEASFDEG
jgi:nucleoside phosphorylase